MRNKRGKQSIEHWGMKKIAKRMVICSRLPSESGKKARVGPMLRPKAYLH